MATHAQGTDGATGAATPPAVSAGMAAIVTAVIVAALVGFIALGSAVGIGALYGGFLLLWYWSTVDKLEMKAAPGTIIGALAGIATAWLLQYAAVSGQSALTMVGLAWIVVALFLSIVNWVPMLVNPAFMLFLTIGAAPLLLAGESYPGVIGGMALAIVYFGVLATIVRAVMARRAPAQPAA